MINLDIEHVPQTYRRVSINELLVIICQSLASFTLGFLNGVALVVFWFTLFCGVCVVMAKLLGGLLLCS